MTSAVARSTLAAAFDIVRPQLPGALVAPEVQTELRRLACTLPSFPRAGFEVRLGARPDVDVQQWLTPSGDEPRRLREHLGLARWDSPAMCRLERFLREWEDSTQHLHDAIGELWLEFDRTHAASSDVRPPLSLFAALDGVVGRDGLDLASGVLDALAPAECSMSWRAGLERCCAACPAGAFVSHIGFMLERPAPFLRVNVKRLEPPTLSAFLGDVGWPGPLDDAVSLMSRTRPLVDRITVCMDVGHAVSGRLGFECAIDGQPPANPRWAAFLAALVEWDLCEPAKRDGLLQWPGVTTPPDTEAPWPAPLIRAGLLKGADHFTALERQLGHVKLTIAPDAPPEAKGYFGFFEGWRRPALDSEAARPAQPPVRVHSDPRARAATRAVAFLLAARGRSGWWHDFSGIRENGLPWRAGSSDEWVTAFVGATLAAVPERSGRRAAREAWDLLCGRRPPGAGWGYNRLMPSDADSTAWGLTLAAAVGNDLSPHARGARVMLARHVIADGGLTTYTLDALAKPGSGRRSREQAYGGWACTSHACVTAAVAPVLGDDRPLEFLRRSQRRDGSWSGYWWLDPEYTTALAGEALAAAGGAADRQCVAAAADWGRERLGSDGSVGGSAFATAWCVRLLALAEGAGGTAATEDTQRATHWLLDHQEQDGGWAASARLLVPSAETPDPAASPLPPSQAVDDARVFTTAAVLSALPSGRP